MLGWGLLGLLCVGMLFFRLAPTDETRWHKPITSEADEDRPGGAVRVVDAGPETLAKLDASMRKLPRTQTLAGSVAEGHVTYVTRSLVFGFPDFTTIQQDGDKVKIFARLRFGASDMGVNRRRLEGLIAELPQR